jgi:MarR family 2-MHQ and catechol resistance regulon transcriptional repressor
MTETPTAGQLWTVLARCYKALSTRVERSVADAGLCLTDFMILEALFHKGPLTISEIQGKILLASGSMTAAVDRLEKKGTIVRRSVPGDRRARRLELTSEGKQVIDHAYGVHRAEFESLMGVLDEREMQQTYASLKRLGLHTAMSDPLHQEVRNDRLSQK